MVVSVGKKEDGNTTEITNYEKEENRPYFGKEAKMWHLYVGDPSLRLSNYKDSLLKLLKDQSAKTVYDVACGLAIDSVMLVEEGFKVVTTDVDEDFLNKAREVKEKRPELDRDWQIGFGDWLDLSAAAVNHPPEGYDVILCIGNSFATLPDFEGEYRTSIKALENYKKLLKIGGMLIVDHYNYDYLLSNKTFPPFKNKNIFYTTDRIFNTKVEWVEKAGKVTSLIFRSDVDVSGTDLESDPEVKIKERNGNQVPTLQRNDIPFCPYTRDELTGLLKIVFGEGADQRVLPDFKLDAPEDYVPNYWVHCVVKS